MKLMTKTPLLMLVVLTSLHLGAIAEYKFKYLSQLKNKITEPKLETLKDTNQLGESASPPPHLKRFLTRLEPKFNSSDQLLSWGNSLREVLTNQIFKFRTSLNYQSKPNYKIKSTTRLYDGELIKKEIILTTQNSTEIPVHVYLPQKSDTQLLPTVIVIPGHVKPSQSGLAQASYIESSYQKGLALKLARSGFVTATFELRGFGNLGGEPITLDHRLVAYNAILSGTFYKAIIASDINKIIDLLSSFKDVDTQRIGITGASLGGEIALNYAAVDTRIKAISIAAYGGALGVKPYITNGTANNQPHYCHIIPGERELMKREEWFMLIAPRPLQVIRGNKDHQFARRFIDQVNNAYAVTNNESQLQIINPPGGHEVFPTLTADFFLKKL